MKTVIGTLPHGLIINGQAEREFEMKEASTGDLFDAEMEAGVDRPLTFNGQLMILQLTRIGSFKGPFTLNMLRGLKTADYRALRKAQGELEADDSMGEASGSAGPAS
ncbi:MAG: hypothetical protein LBE62_03160 [Azonexus sp.]|jgi:phage FluMu protein gp41|nr:hypothetical protein [Azonexus sp.]